MSSRREKYDYDKRKTYSVSDRITEMGKTRIQIQCPFCHEDFWAYIWSLAGGGKKCPKCGAIHSNYGQAAPLREKK